jgi:hypothetical protein
MTIQLTPNGWDKLYKLFILICLIVLALIISDMFKSCSKSEHIDINGTIKAEIKKDILRKDSVKEVIVYRDSIRTKLVTKWRTIRHDSLIPCEDKLIACDTLLVTDSLLISSLKHEIKLTDTIIRNYQKVVYNDSIVIIGLNRSIKKQRNKTKLAVLVAGLFAGFAIVR